MSARTSVRKPGLQPKHIAYAVGSARRWKILTELGKGEPLPVTEIARRTGFTRNGASKVLVQMLAAGLLERGYGALYRIPSQFLNLSEGTIDFGPIVIRLEAIAK